MSHFVPKFCDYSSMSRTLKDTGSLMRRRLSTNAPFSNYSGCDLRRNSLMFRGSSQSARNFSADNSSENELSDLQILSGPDMMVDAIKRQTLRSLFTSNTHKHGNSNPTVKAGGSKFPSVADLGSQNTVNSYEPRNNADHNYVIMEKIEKTPGDEGEVQRAKKSNLYSSMPPSALVKLLDEHIIGQDEAKKAVAIAYRNRWRRLQLPSHQSSEIMSKNILMIGPTGSGKTEIARRLAKICNAPFIKVDATNFTEVGYHGRDVETMVLDLLHESKRVVRRLKREEVMDEAVRVAEDQILREIVGYNALPETTTTTRRQLRSGALDAVVIEADVPQLPKEDPDDNGETQNPYQLLMKQNHLEPKRRSIAISELRRAWVEYELSRRVDESNLIPEATRLAEQYGIIVIDEIDKLIAQTQLESGPSAEGVQRDMLPLLEGTTVTLKKYGSIKTDHILFIAAGAFYGSSPSALLPELLGRLPVHVKLHPLQQDALLRILKDTKFGVLDQQKALLAAEGIDLSFEDDAIEAIAYAAHDANTFVENLGARRLHTVLERVMQDISFAAPDMVAKATSEGDPVPVPCVVTAEMVRQSTKRMGSMEDLRKFIL